MSEHDPTRELLRELVRELLHEALAGGNGHRRHDDRASGATLGGPAPGGGAAPPVPAPPVAAVHRPSTWGRPPAPGEVIGDGAAPHPNGAAPDGVMRVERGAVTERMIKAAAAAGSRVVVGPGAVLTPLAREKARALGIAIERER